MNKIDKIQASIEAIKGLGDALDELTKEYSELGESNVKLNQQLKDKYSTETHLLVNRETLDGLVEKFEELGSEFSNLDGLLEDINSYAGNISDDSGYNDASTSQSYAREYADEIRNLLKVKTEEVAG